MTAFIWEGLFRARIVAVPMTLLHATSLENQ
jgi:hypothetical protein